MDLPKIDTKKLGALGYQPPEITKVLIALSIGAGELVEEEVVRRFSADELKAINAKLEQNPKTTKSERALMMEKEYQTKTGRLIVEVVQEKLQLMVNLFCQIAQKSREKAKRFLQLPEDKQTAIAKALQNGQWDTAAKLWPESR